MEFQCTGTANGHLDFGPYNRAKFLAFLEEHPNIRLTISAQLPESGKLRKFYHGAVLPLWAYLDGKDYRDHAVTADLHEVAKLEFNAAMIVVNGAPKKVGRSTRGSLALRPFVERIIVYLEENYAIDRTRCLDVKDYKHFLDTIYMHGKYEHYIDYLIEMDRVPSTKGS